MWTKSRSLKLSQVLVYLFLAVLIIGSIALPYLVNWFISINPTKEYNYYLLLITLWCCAVPAFIALMTLIKLLKNLSNEQVFIQDNANYIRLLSWCCFSVCIVFFVLATQHYLAIVFVIIVAFMGLILRVIKNVFAHAIEIKTENDLTV